MTIPTGTLAEDLVDRIDLALQRSESTFRSPRMVEAESTSAVEGVVRWSPVKSLWIGGMTAVTLIGVYLFSTLSHLVELDPWRRRFRMLDQGFIYLLIAGSYTPLALTYLNGGWLSVLFATIWGVALLGFLSKTLLQHIHWRNQMRNQG